MADYIVKDTELTSVANAIRTAGGTNSLLSFPNGFVSAVGNISGGGSSDFSTAEVTITSTGGNYIYMPYIESYEDESQLDVKCSDSATYAVILYNGASFGYVPNLEGSVSVTGNILYNNGMFLIQGDGTIAITAEIVD